jgi:Clp amino terminal domain, pathogenicity island component/Double zinc ribbon
MDAKQSQQHRQHFNLSESTKQMLEELTAQRYPGKQRRQSQLVEDLITEAFMKERGMSTVTSMQNPDRFASSTLESLNMAQQEALRMGADAVYPEHLLLGVIAQGENRAAKLLCLSGMDMPALRIRAMEVFSIHYPDANTEDIAFTKETQECFEGAITLAETTRSSQVLPEHLVLRVLHHEKMQEFLTPFLPALNRLIANLAEGMGLVPDVSARRQVREAVKSYTTTPVTKSTCPSCKREVRPGWKHCVFCGTSLAKICPKCGTPGPEVEGARFCFECGSPLT